MPGRHPAKAKGASDDEEVGGIHERTPLKPTESTASGSSKDKDVEKLSVWKNPIRWLSALSENYSWRLLTMVVVTNHLLKGLVAGGGDEGLVGKPIEFIFGDMGISAGRLQILKAAAIAPWALKPVIALLSDACPIMGYKKKPYVIITTVMALCAVFALGLGLATSIPATVACLFLIFLQISSVDLLVEAKQSEEVKQKAKLGPEFFTFTWLGINIGQVLGVAMLGPMIHHFGPRMPYLLAAPFIGLVLWPTLCNFLGEKPVPVEERGCNFRLVARHPVLCSLTLMIGCLIVTLIISTFVLSEGHLISMALFFASLVLAGFVVFIRREIRGPVIFYFLLALLSFNVDGALFYFYTNGPVEYPEGPHFTAYFYTTGIGCAMFVGVMAGFISGAEIFKDWSYRGILKVTILLRVLTQLALLPVLFRWTARLGPMEPAYVFFAVLSDAMVFAWRWIPKQVMGAHLTPSGMEATMLGLTAGTFNMAMILSSYCGGFLLHQLGTRPAGKPQESLMFANLWKAQMIAAIAPCFMLFLLPALIPAKRQTEPLITERRDSATYNSIFEVARRT